MKTKNNCKLKQNHKIIQLNQSNYHYEQSINQNKQSYIEKQWRNKEKNQLILNESKRAKK